MKYNISIKVKNVKKKLGDTQSLDDVTLNFEAGKMHGIIGPEGSGKTTLLRVLLGLLKPDSGKVEFLKNGHNHDNDNNKEKDLNQKQYGALSLEEIRNTVAYMPQTQSLYPDLSIDEHLEFFKELYQLDDKEYQKKREELLRITRLKEFVDRPAGKLSGGMYKKLGLMCALLRSPEVMLLDEPTTGVDPISRREFWDLIYRLLDQKILILISTAYMDEAERCSMVHLLEAGKVIMEGPPRELLKKENVKSFDELFLKSERLSHGKE